MRLIQGRNITKIIMEGMIEKHSFKGKLSEKSEGNVNFPITFLMSHPYACWLLSYLERILLKTCTNNLYYFLEAKWSRWGTWSVCTRTCGNGTRVRSRTCIAQNQRAVFAPIYCAGKPLQKKNCSQWSCPGRQ